MLTMLHELLGLLFIDVIFIGVCLALILPLVLTRHAAGALLKRNFVGYFSNPTGYVFLCLFVLLTSFAAFWPHEFFNANLANLDQLNRFLPMIMLIFIPAITMGIWSEERRQGTDELLLTLPAADFDIVIGKYLAASSIFTCSLLFSQVSNFAVLVALSHGELDTGLLFTTYIGYWFVGLAMLSLGMVASFLTSNLTVGFILGVVFNAPLVFAAQADVIFSTGTAQLVSQWSLGTQFDDFGRGVISLSSMTYFLMVILIGLYMSMVLIGRRHWSRGSHGQSMLSHYFARSGALIVITAGLSYFFANHDWIRADNTEGNVSSLSPDTIKLLRDLENEHPVIIEAFISADVPERYSQTRYDLLSMLKAFQRTSGTDLQVIIHDNLEAFSDEAALAEDRYGIQPQMVRTRSRGKVEGSEIILGAAFKCGLEKIVIPFFDYGIPTEYELVRSIVTVARQKARKKIGIVGTDATLLSRMDHTVSPPVFVPKQPLVLELEKQYEVESVTLTEPVEPGRYDVLVAIQPSLLPAPSLEFLLEAIDRGQPTAIFEDPLPTFAPVADARPAVGTGQPRPPLAGQFAQLQLPPKCDIQRLWRKLGIRVQTAPTIGLGVPPTRDPKLVWQRYNPYQHEMDLPDLYVFASNNAPNANEALSPSSPITSGMSEILFPMPGYISPAPETPLNFQPLAKTGGSSGNIELGKFIQASRTGSMRQLLLAQGPDRGEQILAAHIRSGQPAESDDADGGDADGGDAKNADAAKDPDGMNVVYVADIDVLTSVFMQIRARPDQFQDIKLNFQNVTFFLNIVDVLSGDDDFVEIRKRRPKHNTLLAVEARSYDKRKAERQKREEFQEKYNIEVNKAKEETRRVEKSFEDSVNELLKRQQAGREIDPDLLRARQQDLAQQRAILQRRLEVKTGSFERERDMNVKRIRRDADRDIERSQNEFKVWAVALPPIPPLLVGMIVFVRRRLREREGIAKARMR